MIETATIFLGVFFIAVIYLGIRVLPRERWQFIATIPFRKNPDDTWLGLNLTYYGAITATSYVIAVSIFFFLAQSRALPLGAVSFLIMSLLGLCMPAARLIALVVEKKKHTFSVGGASFAGIIAAPCIILGYNYFSSGNPIHPLPPLAALAAISVAYAFGEGFGRLACLSFGCCYGKPLDQAPAWIQTLCRHHGLTFIGKTKKAAYAHGLDGRPLVPVQVMTMILYSAAGLIGFYLFLKGLSGAALFITLATTQLWRVFSEFLRADHRGGGKITAYQIMSLVSIAYVAAVAFLLPADHGQSQLLPALKGLWSPNFIVAMQLLWLLAFVYSGRSEVTSATVDLKVLSDRI